jgi:hypothetical protein
MDSIHQSLSTQINASRKSRLFKNAGGAVLNSDRIRCRKRAGWMQARAAWAKLQMYNEPLDAMASLILYSLSSISNCSRQQLQQAAAQSGAPDSVQSTGAASDSLAIANFGCSSNTTVTDAAGVDKYADIQTVLLHRLRVRLRP